ncbi:hypothetical protein OG218_00255 [Kineococcus sp. NBC_00420]|uniref:hypothetical protein n=1 Tax=Kineococcus sp. NBC_00420 TaxID=2903564 RepID=UPI002E1A187B
MIEQFEESPGDAGVEAQLRRDLQARPAPTYTPDLQAVKRRGKRRRRRAQVLPAVVVLAVVGLGTAAVSSGALTGREGAVRVVSAHGAGSDSAGRDLPAWCQGGSITYDSDGSGYSSPELAVQYLIDVSDSQEEHLKAQPRSAEIDNALVQNSAVLGVLHAVQEEASRLGVDRVRRDGAVVVRDEDGKTVAQARFVEVQPSQWNVATLSFSAPVVSECSQ